MLTLNDGRKELYQWDTGRTATVDIECDVVHFANLKYGESLAVEVKVGKVAIPNKLLMSGEQIYCWAFVKDENGAYTKKEQTLVVTKRAKPSDYVYTETEIITIQTAVENALQEAKESGDFKGEKGDKGDTGENGISVTVSSVSESTDDGGQNLVTFSDGKTLTVKNGSRGSQGEKGDPTDVQQTTGQSKTAVMSQKATTYEINLLKNDLANKLPKSPVNWEKWTENEQAAAREKIGIVGDYELIDDITTDEDVVSVVRNVAHSGDAYNFSAVALIINVPGTPDKSGIVRVDLYYDEVNYIALVYGMAGIGNTKKRTIVIWKKLSDCLYIYGGGIENTQNQVAPSRGFNLQDKIYEGAPYTGQTCIKIRVWPQGGTGMLPAGTNIKIYGVRA